MGTSTKKEVKGNPNGRSRKRKSTKTESYGPLWIIMTMTMWTRLVVMLMVVVGSRQVVGDADD